MPGNESIQILRGTRDKIKNNNDKLLPGQLLYNYDDNYLTVGTGANTTKSLCGTPITVPTLEGYFKDADANGNITISDNTDTASYYIKPSNNGSDKSLNIYSSGQIKLQSEVSILSGNLTFATTKGIKYAAMDNDTQLWQVYDGNGDYGYTLQYNGSGSGNDNDLVLISDNQSGAKINAVTMKQDGTTTFAKAITASEGLTVGSTLEAYATQCRYYQASLDVSTAGWYRIYTSAYGNASGKNTCYFTLGRNYSSPQNEEYAFSVSVGYNGQISITQLSGCIGGHLLTKIRVVYKNQSTFYIDFYSTTSESEYKNTYYVYGIGSGIFQTPTAVSSVESDYLTYEFETVNGCKSDKGFTGDLNGNAATATKLKTTRTIALTGSVTGSGTFDGSGDLSIETTTNHTHMYAGSSSVGGPARSLEVFDTRAVNDTPTSITELVGRGARLDFKQKSITGLNIGSYAAVLSISPWTDVSNWSGGKNTQLAFTDDGNIHVRKGDNTGWTNWNTLTFNDHDHDDRYVNVGGDAMAGALTTPNITINNSSTESQRFVIKQSGSSAGYIELDGKATFYINRGNQNSLIFQRQPDSGSTTMIEDARFDPSGNFLLGKKITLNNQDGTVTAQSFNAQSDRRLKENITDYKSSTDKSILNLPLYRFDFIDGIKNQIGCLAQDLQEICPELVDMNQETNYLSIKESKIVYLVIEELKKLRKELDELKKS